jgi:hypothetical protein
MSQLGITTWNDEADTSGVWVFNYTYAGDMNLDGALISADFAVFSTAVGANSGSAD